MTDTPSTPEQHQAIKQAAHDRLRLLLWLADQLASDDGASLYIQREAAAAIRQLMEGIE